jgi:hypothetical protein
MAVTRFFPPSIGSLTTFGHPLDSTIPTGRNAAGTILVNGGALPIRGGSTTVANRCGHCGGRFGMVTHRWWGNKFCKRTCKDAYLRELVLGRDEIGRWFGWLRGEMRIKSGRRLASGLPYDLRLSTGQS